MSENEQKAGCVDDAAVERGLQAAREASDARLPRYSVVRAILEAAALPPARSGEAVAWTVVGPDGQSSIGGWMDMRHYAAATELAVLREGHRYEFAYRALGVIAPRNESSVVGPGGGGVSCCVQHPEDFPCYVCYPDRYPLPTAAAPETYATTTLTLPAPQDSVRVGDGAEPAWQNIDTAEAEFLNNLADNGGLDPLVAGMLRHCARLMPKVTTPAPAAGADGEGKLTVFLSDGAGQSAGGGR